jgi:hypothetical protein
MNEDADPSDVYEQLQSETPTSNLTSDERKVFGAPKTLPSVTDATTEAITRVTGLAGPLVGRTLRRLAGMEPPLVREDVDANTGRRFWIVDDEAVAAFEDANRGAESDPPRG